MTPPDSPSPSVKLVEMISRSLAYGGSANASYIDRAWPSYTGVAERVLSAIADAGLVVVPREPTPAMREAGRIETRIGPGVVAVTNWAANRWAAMIAAGEVGGIQCDEPSAVSPSAWLPIETALAAYDAEMAKCPINNGSARGALAKECPRCSATESQNCGLNAYASDRFVELCRALVSPKSEPDASPPKPLSSHNPPAGEAT